REEGFTLIELMVVVLIIAILIAIAIPTFLGARKRAQDRAAQSSLRNALTAAKTIFTDHEDYTEATVTALAGSQPSLGFSDGTQTQGDFGASGPGNDPRDVVIKSPDANTFEASVFSKSGNCFYIKDVNGPTNGTGLGTHYASVPGDAADNTCSAAE